MRTTTPPRKVIARLIQRAELGNQEYLITGHPDAFFRDGVRREIKAYGDRLSINQRKELEWMTACGQPWEILQEIWKGPVLRIRHLDTYDRYLEYRGAPRYKINADDAKIIRAAARCGELRSKLAKAFGVSAATIDNVVNLQHCSHR